MLTPYVVLTYDSLNAQLSSVCKIVCQLIFLSYS